MKTNKNRRKFLAIAGGASVLALLSTKGYAMFGFGNNDEESKFPYQLTEAEWKEKLTAEEFRVLRKHGTERAGLSPLDDEKRDGVFHCAGCDQQLFATKHKFDSGTGWPSFYQPIDGVDSQYVGTSTDYKLIYPRTEVHCANCGGHLGHVFEDGPEPTGLRYCMNGVAMKFKSA
jgi:peptide-methionine (R)-S-oxide reductase